MITEFILTIPYYILNALISIIPTGAGIPSEFVSAVHSIWGYMESFAFIVPISTLLWCLTITLTFEAGVFVFQAFNWLLKKLPNMN